MTVVRMPGRGARRTRAIIVDTERDAKVIDFYAPMPRRVAPPPPAAPTPSAQRPTGPRVHLHPYVNDLRRAEADERFMRRMLVLVAMAVAALVLRGCQ